MRRSAGGAGGRSRRARDHGLDDNHVWNGLMWAIIPAIIGARLYHVLTPTPSAIAPDGSPLTVAYYFNHPLEIMAVCNGGLGIYGGIRGRAGCACLYARGHGQPSSRWMAT